MFSKLLLVTALILFVSAPFVMAGEIAASEKDTDTKTEQTKKHTATKSTSVRSTAKDLTLDEVLENYYEAIGGLKNWEAVRTMILQGTMISQGTAVPVKATYMRPNKCKVEFKIKDAILVQAHDGEKSWQFNPHGKIKLPQPMSKGRSDYLHDTCDIDGPLNNYKDKGNEIEFLGQEEIYGNNTYKLRVKHKTGNVQTYYLDSSTFLPLRLDGVYQIDGVETKVTTSYFNYKKKGKLMIPYKLDLDIAGAPGTEQVNIRSVTINPPVKESIFKKP